MPIILRENEKLVKVVHQHSMFLMQALFTWPWLIIALVLVRYLLKFTFFGYWNLIITIAVIVVAIIIFYRYYIWRMNALVITDQRVIENKQLGFFAKTVTELLYQDILEISYTKTGMNASIYDFGDLKIRTASNSEMVFEKTPQPDQIVGLINNIRQQKKMQSNYPNV